MSPFGIVHELTSLEQTNTFLNASKKSVLFFWAAWQESSARSSELQEVYNALSQKYAKYSINFGLVEAEAVPEVSELYNISVVPTFLFFTNGKVTDRLESFDLEKLNQMVKKLTNIVDVEVEEVKPQQSEISLNDRLHALINSAKVKLFMKGNPDAPRCGFSRQIVQILNEHHIDFASFDILEDEEVRQGLKTYSDWPTYPQLYVNGELVGGLDIVKEMVATGNFRGELGL